MHDLVKALLVGKRQLHALPKTTRAKLGDIFECLKDFPLMDVLKLVDNAKAHNFFSAIDKIVSLAHVSQSMGNYFARDEALDPALCIICEGLRGNTDFEYMLRKRGGTFQTLASAYHHLKSATDRDATKGTQYKTRPRRQRTTRQGFCWQFQKTGRCTRRDCRFAHRCAICNDRSHGENECKSNGGTW